ncbi:MAG: D-alanine--D-alanine ligase family protein [Planctomycetota bacterium]
MRICLLTNQDLDADPFPDDDWPCDPRPYLPDAEWHVAVLEKRTSVRTIKALAKRGFDVFFNLCDGAADEQSPGIEVIRTLERLGVAFTGSNSKFYEPSRVTVKRACKRVGVATPNYVMASDDSHVERATRLRFPLIVKHHSSYASIDLSRASRVVSPAGLRRQANKIIRKHGKALIEEFIEGREATVLVAEGRTRPKAYTPVEYHFPEGESFKHADMKWVDYDDMAELPVEDKKLAARLKRESCRVFTELDGAGFGRCDFRIDEDGTPYLLEINANCGIYYPLDEAGGADLCLVHDPGGHAAFTRRLVDVALARTASR